MLVRRTSDGTAGTPKSTAHHDSLSDVKAVATQLLALMLLSVLPSTAFDDTTIVLAEGCNPFELCQVGLPFATSSTNRSFA
jgi:hypothetical protein